MRETERPECKTRENFPTARNAKFREDGGKYEVSWNAICVPSLRMSLTHNSTSFTDHAAKAEEEKGGCLFRFLRGRPSSIRDRRSPGPNSEFDLGILLRVVFCRPGLELADGLRDRISFHF